MTASLFDRLKNLAMTAFVNWRHPVTKAEHDRQRALVLLREQLSDDKTERHNSYPPIRANSGWRHSQQTPPPPAQRPS